MPQQVSHQANIITETLHGTHNVTCSVKYCKTTHNFTDKIENCGFLEKKWAKIKSWFLAVFWHFYFCCN